MAEKYGRTGGWFGERTSSSSGLSTNLRVDSLLENRWLDCLSMGMVSIRLPPRVSHVTKSSLRRYPTILGLGLVASAIFLHSIVLSPPAARTSRYDAATDPLHRHNLLSPTLSINIDNGTIRHTYNESLRKYRDMPPWMDKFPIFPSVDDVPDEQRVCFVHVGKTAGSTLSCYLGFRYPACQDHIQLVPGNLPQVTTNLIHTHYDTCQRANIALYLFTLRDPLERMLSWFTYERPTNATSERQIAAKRPLYLDCNYQSMDEVGLALSTKNNNRTTEECARVAWRAVQGLHGYMSHNKYNYGHYWRMFEQNTEPDADAARIVVVRTEHLEPDWASVEAIVSAAAAVDPNNRPATPTQVTFPRKNKSRKKEQDRHLSSTAHRNLCDALCEEIQVYKKLLRRAENLTPEDIDESMQELRGHCPIQADRETCPQRPDFGIQEPVPKR